MRIWHLNFAVIGCAFMLVILREPAGRVGVVVFVMGSIICALTLAGIMALFKSIGAIGEARTVFAHLQALAQTAAVLAITTVVVCATLFVGISFVILVAD